MKNFITLPLRAAALPLAAAGLILTMGFTATSAMAMPFGGNFGPGAHMSQERGGMPMRGLTRLHDELKLDAKQEALWQEALKAGQEAHTAMRTRFTTQHDEMKKLLDTPNADLRAVMKRMDDFRAEGQKLHDENRERLLKVYDALTPEQKEKVRLFIKDGIDRQGGKGGKGDHGGRGGHGRW